jgi:hypothetical protein
MKAKIFESLAVQLERMIRLQGDKIGFEGSWSGNETVAKMTLDLNRILLYGRADSSIADSVQRRVLHLVDAVIAGQGDGPLAPMELTLKRILAGNNAAAVDWVGAHLLGFDARKIPLLRHAFSSFRWPIVDLDPQEIKILSDRELPESVCSLLESEHCQNVIYPAGWQDAKA